MPALVVHHVYQDVHLHPEFPLNVPFISALLLEFPLKVSLNLSPNPCISGWRAEGSGGRTSHGARPVHLIITMIKWIRTSRFSMKISLSHTVSGEDEALVPVLVVHDVYQDVQRVFLAFQRWVFQQRQHQIVYLMRVQGSGAIMVNVDVFVP